MRTSYIKSLVAAILVGCTMGASAQALHSSYFLDGMVERHELNPAFGGEANFIALPGLSGSNLGGSTNFGRPHCQVRYRQVSFSTAFLPTTNCSYSLTFLSCRSDFVAWVALIPLVSRLVHL